MSVTEPKAPGPADAQLPGEPGGFLGAVAALAHDPEDVGVAHADPRADVEAGHEAGADDADAERSFCHGMISSCSSGTGSSSFFFFHLIGIVHVA